MARRADQPLRPLAGADFQRELEMESLRAGRGRCPLSLLLLAPDCPEEKNRKKDAQALLRSIAAHMSPCDSLGLLPNLRYALLLPGAGIFRARNIAENILRHFEDSGCACAIGLAGAEFSEQVSAETLLQQALCALRKAQGQDDKITVYREEAEALSLRKTLVHSHEKRFLFSGGE